MGQLPLARTVLLEVEKGPGKTHLGFLRWEGEAEGQLACLLVI